tara:strand:- start:619 stop:1272 length:654 start_codon:yes stop_codon:yes gene_type:complete
MKYYSFYGVKDFIICGGYKVEQIKNFFINLKIFLNDLEIDYKNQQINLLTNKNLDWNVKVIDTGLKSMTGGRLKKIKKYFNKDENFFLTYGDGLSNININSLKRYHLKSNKVGTMTIVIPPARYGAVETKKNLVTKFQEKQKDITKYINGGFFVFNYKIFNYLRNSNTILEEDVLTKLSSINQLQAFKHHGFWQSMDSLRDKLYLEEVWKKNPLWKK